MDRHALLPSPKCCQCPHTPCAHAWHPLPQQLQDHRQMVSRRQPGRATLLPQSWLMRKDCAVHVRCVTFCRMPSEQYRGHERADFCSIRCVTPRDMGHQGGSLLLQRALPGLPAQQQHCHQCQRTQTQAPPLKPRLLFLEPTGRYQWAKLMAGQPHGDVLPLC